MLLQSHTLNESLFWSNQICFWEAEGFAEGLIFTVQNQNWYYHGISKAKVVFCSKQKNNAWLGDSMHFTDKYLDCYFSLLHACDGDQVLTSRLWFGSNLTHCHQSALTDALYRDSVYSDIYIHVTVCAVWFIGPVQCSPSNDRRGSLCFDPFGKGS